MLDTNYYLQPQPSRSPRSQDLLRRTYQLYRTNFRTWLAITAPASILATAVVIMADDKVRAISYAVSPRDYVDGWREMLEAFLIRYGAYFLAWLLGCFALGAVATLVSKIEEDERSESWFGDNYERARERFGPLFRIALITFALLLVGLAAVMFVEVALLRMRGRSFSGTQVFWFSIVSYLTVASVLAWFGMAIPLAVCDGTTAWQGLRRSLRLSNGFEVYLFLLVLESVVGSYVAWMAVSYAAMPLIARFPIDYNWLAWIQLVLTVLASASVQPPLFIGLSLLTRRDEVEVSVAATPGTLA